MHIVYESDGDICFKQLSLKYYPKKMKGNLIYTIEEIKSTGS